jgi:hypothetical protein
MSNSKFEHTTEPDCICDSCCAESARRMEREQEAQETAATIASFLNHSNPQDLALAISRQHRTLQQLFSRVCIEWARHCAALPEGAYDLRNADSVDFFRKVTATKEWQQNDGLRYV